MKTIKITAIAFALLGFLVSCNQQGIESISAEKLVPVTLTASIDKAKVSFKETPDMNLKPTWVVGDNVYAFNGSKIEYTFAITAVDATGKATLSGNAPASCTLHLVYIGNSSSYSVSGNKINVSYAGQKGDNTIPAVMLADGEVKYGKGNFNFTNGGAIIGIDAVKGVPVDSEISKIRVEGENLSSATISLAGSALALSATDKDDDVITTDKLSGVKVDDASGKLSKPVLIAVPAGAEVSGICVKVGSKKYVFEPSSTVQLSRNVYSYIDGRQKFDYIEPNPDYVEIAGIKWARQNLAVSTSGNMAWKGNGSSAVKVPETDLNVIIGDYFQWGTHEKFSEENPGSDKGLIIYKSFNCAKCVGGSGYSYSLKTKADGAKENFNFTIDYCPFFENRTPMKYTDNTDLSLEDDAANVFLGGNWRMPTSNECKSLIENTTWTWNYPASGFYLTEKGEALEEDKSNALLFIPAAGELSDWGFEYINKGDDEDKEASCCYWTKSREGDAIIAAFAMWASQNNSTIEHRHGEPRWKGLPIRPVLAE